MSENPDDGLTEKIKILATDDEKIKSFGELFTNDSSREILQLLFNEEMTANQIAQKTDISLQLVKYHLNKLQDLGVVKISKVEKNSKSQDMKVYSATKFSIVIVPPKLSEKTKESKLLVRSFRHIYKVAGLA
ncbi:MAG: ArsR family transcriptional regulator, partial [Nitrosopumilus sp.]